MIQTPLTVCGGVCVLIIVQFVSLCYGSCNQLRLVNDCVCPGLRVVYECYVEGAGFTIWRIPNCCDITLDHLDFINRSSSCSNCQVTGHGIDIEGNCYKSKLEINISEAILGENVICSLDNGTTHLIDMSAVLYDRISRPLKAYLAESNQGKFMIKWNSTFEACSSQHYNIFSSNCGNCPRYVNDTYVICTYSTGGTQCEIIIQPVICGIHGSNATLTVNLKLGDGQIAGIVFGIFFFIVIVIMVVIALCYGYWTSWKICNDLIKHRRNQLRFDTSANNSRSDLPHAGCHDSSLMQSNKCQQSDAPASSQYVPIVSKKSEEVAIKEPQPGSESLGAEEMCEVDGQVLIDDDSPTGEGETDSYTAKDFNDHASPAIERKTEEIASIERQPVSKSFAAGGKKMYIPDGQPLLCTVDDDSTTGECCGPDADPDVDKVKVLSDQVDSLKEQLKTCEGLLQEKDNEIAEINKKLEAFAEKDTSVLKLVELLESEKQEKKVLEEKLAQMESKMNTDAKNAAEEQQRLKKQLEEKSQLLVQMEEKDKGLAERVSMLEEQRQQAINDREKIQAECNEVMCTLQKVLQEQKEERQKADMQRQTLKTRLDRQESEVFELKELIGKIERRTQKSQKIPTLADIFFKKVKENIKKSKDNKGDPKSEPSEQPDKNTNAEEDQSGDEKKSDKE